MRFGDVETGHVLHRFGALSRESGTNFKENVPIFYNDFCMPSTFAYTLNPLLTPLSTKPLLLVSHTCFRRRNLLSHLPPSLKPIPTLPLQKKYTVVHYNLFTSWKFSYINVLIETTMLK